MAAIVATLINVFVRFFDFLRLLWGVLAAWVSQVWAAYMLVLDALLAAFTSIFIFALQAITEVILFVLALAVSILPLMPATVENTGSLDLNAINRYVPFTEVAALTGVWVAIFAAIGAYKLAKFVRGGG